MLSAAKGDNKALILLMLNCAMYLQEVVRVRWDELEGNTLITNRHKTGEMLRVGYLWDETTAALKEVKRRGEYVFISETGLPLTISGAEKRFGRIRKAANLPSVQGSHFRDGAFTAMRLAHVPRDLYTIVVGHAGGTEDFYTLLDPTVVKPATDAIRAFYFSGKSAIASS